MSRVEKRKKKKKKITIVFIIILIIIILAGIFVGKIISSKLGNINFEDIDKTQLSMNDDLYNQISDYVTVDEYKKIKNFVLFGTDTQSTGDGQDREDFAGRTDTIIIVSINPKYKSIKLISIPRDTYAEIEGYGKNKINHAYTWGGVQLAVKTINENFELNLSEYVTVDFSGLVHIINDIGGIKMNISAAEEDFINKNSKLAYKVSGNKQKFLNSYGNVLLDGEQAVTHARNRTVGDGDFTRAERQRLVIEAMFSKISSMEAGDIYNLIDVLLKEVTTNINVMDYMGLLGEIVVNRSSYLNNIISTQVPKEEYAESQTIKGIYYFVPTDVDKMKEEMIEYMYKK